jgi:hypothetical protein
VGKGLFRVGALAALAAALVAPASLAGACGGIGDWIGVYQRGERHKALFHLLDCASGYRPLQDDPALLPVVADALRRREEVANLGVKVFEEFNALYGGRSSPGYPGVLAEVRGRGAEIDLDRYRDWWVVTAPSGAWLRAEPHTGSRTITSLPAGVQVRLLKRRGEWFQVTPVGTGPLNPRFYGAEGYVHGSLLAEY